MVQLPCKQYGIPQRNRVCASVSCCCITNHPPNFVARNHNNRFFHSWICYLGKIQQHSWSTPCCNRWGISTGGWTGHIQDGAPMWLASWFRLWAKGLGDVLEGGWPGSKSKSPKRTRWAQYDFLYHSLRHHVASLVHKPVQIQ